MRNQRDARASLMVAANVFYLDDELPEDDDEC